LIKASSDFLHVKIVETSLFSSLMVLKLVTEILVSLVNDYKKRDSFSSLLSLVLVWMKTSKAALSVWAPILMQLTKTRFKNVLGVVISQALDNTTAQINLLDFNEKPTETDVPVLLYDHTSGKVKESFVIR